MMEKETDYDEQFTALQPRASIKQPETIAPGSEQPNNPASHNHDSNRQVGESRKPEVPTLLKRLLKITEFHPGRLEWKPEEDSEDIKGSIERSRADSLIGGATLTTSNSVESPRDVHGWEQGALNFANQYFQPHMPVDPSLFDAEVESLPDLIDQLNLEDKNELSQTVMSTALISYGDMNSMLHHSQSPLQSRYNRTPSHTASRKWLSPREIQKKKFRRMKNVINDQFPDSEVGEWDFDSYTQHNLDVYDVKKEELIKKTAQMANRQASIVPAYPAFGGKQFNDGRGTVLCNSTIWTHDWDNVARSAYPSKAELRYEGIERAKTNCRRCLPIPRMPASNDGVNWYMCPATEPLYWDHRYTFDIVPMHAEDIYLDYDLLVEEEGLSMLNDDLKEEMENEAEVFTSKA